MTEPSTDNVMKTYTRQGGGHSKPHSNRKRRRCQHYLLQVWNKETHVEKVLQKKCCAITVRTIRMQNHFVRKRVDKMASEKLQRSKVATKTSSQGQICQE